MKRWAILTTLLYLMLVVALIWPVLYVGFLPHTMGHEQEIAWHIFEGAKESSDGVPGWLFVGGIIATLALCQAALLIVPVKLASRRTVSQRTIAWPIVGVLTAVAILIISSVAASYEFLSETHGIGFWNWAWGFVGLGAMWLLWTFMFGFYVGRATPRTAMARIVQTLIAGSVFELLIAVPAHICARVRNNCCAGAFTTWGLWTGIAVLLMAFGPAAFVAFARRYGSLKRESAGKEHPSAGGQLPPDEGAQMPDES